MHIKLAKKHKLESMTIGDISFSLREPTKRLHTRAVTQGEIALQGGMPSDEDMLFYSAESAIQVPKSN